MRQHLLARGARYRTADGRLLFFSHEECRLYDPQETSFTQGLLAASGLATTAPVFNFARDMLTAHVARQGTLVEIHPLSHYDVQSQVLTVSNGGGGV